MSNVTPRRNSYENGLFIGSSVDDAKLSLLEFRVYAHLCRRANDKERVWSSQKNMAAICCVSVDSISRALKSLAEKGWITRKPQYRDDGSRTTDEITINGLPDPDHTAKTGAGPSAKTWGGFRPNREQEGIPLEGVPVKHNQASTKPPSKVVSDIPVKLQLIHGFSEKWNEWLEFRRVELKKPLKPTSIKTQFKMLSEDSDPIACIERSISAGYQGLFPSVKKNVPTQGTTYKTLTPFEDDPNELD